MKLCLSTLFLTLCLAASSWAQEVLGSVDTLGVPEVIGEIPGGENVLDQIQTEVEDTELMDHLLWLKEHPFDLNTVSREELETIPGVTPADASAIVDLRKFVKRFTSVSQLASIEENGEGILKKVRLYVIVRGDQRDMQPQFGVTIRSRTTKDLQTRKGYADNSFLGSPLKSYNRMVLARSNLEAGALFEKDAGERVADGFASGYVRLRDWSFVSGVVVGDYTVESGQGLVLWRGTAFGKGSDAVSIVQKSSLGAQPYRSTDEFNFLRGVAANSQISTRVGEFHVSAFFSRRSLSGTISTADTVSSFYEEGSYRTDSELKRKNAVNERMIGGRVRFKGLEEWNVGVSYYHSSFDKYTSQGLMVRGLETAVGGIDAKAQFDRISMFGEVARSEENALAGIAGAILAIGPKTSVAIVYRDYSPQFNNVHAHGFGENDGTSNERGMYIGLETPLIHSFKLTGYFDQFKFPSQTYSSPLPTQGHEVLAQLDGTLTRRLELTARFTTKTVEGIESVTDPYNRSEHEIVDRSQQKVRLTGTYRVSRQLCVKGRLELTQVDYPPLKRGEQGNLFYQEVQWKPSDAFSLEARLILFDTYSYDSRLYEYENDLRGVFSNPALYGKGRRWYLLLGYSPNNLFRISAKYSETQKDGVKSIGSGLTEISGDLDNHVSVQLDVKL
jgi:hypothetical protein